MEIKNLIQTIAQQAKTAEPLLNDLSFEQKNDLLQEIANNLDKNREKIKEQNKIDTDNAENNNMSKALIDRLILDDSRIDGMITGIEDIIKLGNPLDRVLEEITRPNGLIIKKVSVPIGVIGIIYESRPNVTVDVAAICIKSGNVVILKGGKEAFASNKVLVDIIREAITNKGYCPDIVQLIETTDREAVGHLLKMSDYIDLIIPRGGEGLIRMVAENSTIPVLKHYKGVCHIYVDNDADINMAVDIAINAKCQRPGVCNAVETLLVNKKIAQTFLPIILKKMQDKGVELRGCEQTKEVLSDIADATEDDWYEEYLDLILAVRIVDTVQDAINHINKYGSRHSDAIITNNNDSAKKFLFKVDSSSVYHNASTRFTDGGEFGKGAEMGISTDKLHARGPVGIEELTTYKYLIFGQGQVR